MSYLHTAVGMAALAALGSGRDPLDDPYDFTSRIASMRRNMQPEPKKAKSAKVSKSNAKSKAAHKARMKQRRSK